MGADRTLNTNSYYDIIFDLRYKNMTSVSLSPKFQIVIPKDVRRALNLVAGQRMEARVVGDRVELVPELPITSIRGMCRGINTDAPNDLEEAQAHTA